MSTWVLDKLNGVYDIMWSSTLTQHSHLTSMNSDYHCNVGNSSFREKLLKIGILAIHLL